MKFRHEAQQDEARQAARDRVVFDDDIEVIGGHTGPGASGRYDEERTRGDSGAERAHRRFGGIDVPAIIAGMLTAIGTAVLLGGVLAAIGSVGYQLDVERNSERLSAGGFIAGLVTLLISFAVGGWAAGRIARYDGARNGLLSAVLFLVIAALFGAAGAQYGTQYDVFGEVRLPNWFSDWSQDSSHTAIAIASAVAAVLVVLAAAWLGGLLGSRYHERADALIAQTREGGVARRHTARAVVSSSQDDMDRDRRRDLPARDDRLDQRMDDRMDDRMDERMDDRLDDRADARIDERVEDRSSRESGGIR